MKLLPTWQESWKTFEETCGYMRLEWVNMLPTSMKDMMMLVFLLTVLLQSFWVLQITYLLTAWCRVLLEKLTGLQLVKKFPAFHGTRRFITTLTSVCHLSLSWASPIQSIYPHPTSWRSILISTHLRLGLPSGLLPNYISIYMCVCVISALKFFSFFKS